MPFDTGDAAETPEDAAYVSKRLQEVLEFEKTGVVISWKNPKTKNQGTIKVVRTYYQTPKLPCRDYIRTQELRGDLTMTVMGTGCRIGDERWFLEEQPPHIEDPKSAGSAARKTPAKNEGAAKPSADPTAPAKETELPAENLGDPVEKSPGDEKAAEAKKSDKVEKDASGAATKPSTPKFDYQLPNRTTLSDVPPS